MRERSMYWPGSSSAPGGEAGRSCCATRATSSSSSSSSWAWRTYYGSSRVGKGGLGYSILYASTQLQTDYLFALVLAATVLGFGFFFVVKVLEWYFLHRWHESARTPEIE